MKFSLFIFFSLFSFSVAAQDSVLSKEDQGFRYSKNPDVVVWKVNDSIVAYRSEMTIDADGSPQAYNSSNTGTDDTAYAYSKSMKKLNPDIIVYAGNKPYIQDSLDPFPGYYLSMTALVDGTKKSTDYRRYVNSDSIPYIAIPANLKQHVKLGDIVYVYYKATGKSVYAIIADIGSNTHIGEGSVKLAEELGIEIKYKDEVKQIKGSVADKDVYYIIFKNSGTGKPLSREEIINRGEERVKNIAVEKILILFN